MSVDRGLTSRFPTSNVGPLAITPINASAGHRREQVVSLAVGAYVLFFYLIESLIKPIPVKSRALAWLLLPDELISQWVGGHFSRFGLLDRVPLMCAAAAILVGGFLAGRLLLDLLRVDRLLTRGETVLMSIGVGLNLLSLGTLAVGLAGLLHQQLLFWLVGALVALAAVARCRAWSKQNGELSTTPSAADQGKPYRLALALSLPFILLILLGGMLPPWQFDVREYHLQVPKEWFRAGRISFLPHNVYGNMPLGAEMHVLLGMCLVQDWCDWWWGALVGKTVIASFAPLTALAVFSLGQRFISPTVGAIAAFVVISTPWMAHVSMAGLIEGAYAFYLVLAVYAALLAADCRPQAGRTANANDSFRLILLAGFQAGAAVACKYPALLFVVVPLLAWTTFGSCGTWRTRRPPADASAKLSAPSVSTTQRPAAHRLLLTGGRLALFSSGVVLACGLWFAKNWVQTGNPTYPLLYEWFDGRTRTEQKHEQWSRAHRAPENGWSVSQLARSAATVAFSSDYSSPLLLPLGMLAVFSRRHRRLVLPLAGLLVVVFAAWWGLTHRIDRFLVPLLPVAALLAAVGGVWSSGLLWRRFLGGLLVASALANLCLVSSRDVSDNRFLVRLSELRRDRENAYDPGYFHLHRTHDTINSLVRPGFAVLLVGEAQPFNIEVESLYNTCFDDCLFESLMKGRSRAERWRVLRDRRISHVFFFWRELDRYRSPGNYGYSDYATRERVHREFVEQQGLLRPVPLPTDPQSSELFEVVGWRSFATANTKE